MLHDPYGFLCSLLRFLSSRDSLLRWWRLWKYFLACPSLQECHGGGSGAGRLMSHILEPVWGLSGLATPLSETVTAHSHVSNRLDHLHGVNLLLKQQKKMAQQDYFESSHLLFHFEKSATCILFIVFCTTWNEPCWLNVLYRQCFAVSVVLVVCTYRLELCNFNPFFGGGKRLIVIAPPNVHFLATG